MTILRNLLEARSALENPLLPLTSTALLDVLGAGHKTHTGITVSETTAPKRFIAVYRAVALVSGVIATLPLQAFRQGPERTRFRSRLLEDPHPELTAMELWERVLFHLLLTGDSYSAAGRDSMGAITELEPLPPWRVKPHRVPRSATNRWGKEYVVAFDDGHHETFTPWDVLHIPGPGYDGLHGLSPIGVARQGIGLGLAAEEYGARLFGSGALMAGVLTTEQELTADQAQDRKERWREKVAGLAHAHELAILDKGVKFEKIGIPPEDAQFVESRKFQVTEIARLYGIPPHLLGDVERSTSWGSGLEEQNIGFIVYTLGAWMARIEQRVSKAALPRGVMAEFNAGRLLRGNAKARAEAAQIWLQNGVKSRNAVRLEENEPPVEGGDRFMVPVNLSILGDDGLPVHVGSGSTTPDPDQTPPAEPAPQGDPDADE